MFDLTVFWRVMQTNAINMIIKIGGLAIGIATCLIFSLYIYHEINFDNFWHDSKKIWRIDTVEAVPGRNPIFVAGAPAIAGEMMQEEFPEFTSLTRGIHKEFSIQKDDKTFISSVMITDQNFMSFFNMPLIYGNNSHAIKDNNSIALSETSARKYFGSKNPIGKSVTLLTPTERDYIVTAVYQDIPKNSHMKFDALIRLHPKVTSNMQGIMNNWGNPSFKTYVKIDPKVNIHEIEKRFPLFLSKYFPAEYAASINVKAEDIFKFKLIALDEIHLKGAKLLAMSPRANIDLLKTFSFISILILISSTFNFINLSVVMAIHRDKEIAIRKTLGASNLQVIFLFVLESVLISLIAFLLALVIIDLLLPVISYFISQEFPINIYERLNLLAVILIIVIILGIFIGLFPALKMSSIRPSEILHAGKSKLIGLKNLRLSFTFLQFALSTGMIISTFVILNQIKLIDKFDHKFKTRNIVLLRDIPDPEINVPLLKDALSSLSEVKRISSSSFVPLEPSEHNFAVRSPASNKPFIIGHREISENFFETYDVPLKYGRLLSNIRDGENKGSRGIILNVAAAKKIGFSNSKDALGTFLYHGKNYRNALEVVGIIDNVYLNSIHREIRDEIYLISSKSNTISISFNPDFKEELVINIEDIWKRRIETIPLKLEFIESILEQTYKKDYQNGYLISALTILAVFIANIGLYAIAALIINNSIKEIIIRKVLGANTISVIVLMLKRLLVPIFVATLTAWPIAYYIMNEWLSNFSHHVSLEIDYFLIAGILNITIACITVFSHILRASYKKPSYFLRHA